MGRVYQGSLKASHRTNRPVRELPLLEREESKRLAVEMVNTPTGVSSTKEALHQCAVRESYRFRFIDSLTSTASENYGDVEAEGYLRASL